MEVYKPQDKFFRSWFSRIENLTHFLETAPPPEVFALLDPSTLTVQDETYIDEHHREHQKLEFQLFDVARCLEFLIFCSFRNN